MDTSGEHIIPEFFKSYDNKKKVDGPSKWKITNKKTSPHSFALTNESDITNFDGTSTIIHHKYQTCFDCVIGFSFKVQTDDAVVNFMFKFIDLEN